MIFKFRAAHSLTIRLVTMEYALWFSPILISHNLLSIYIISLLIFIVFNYVFVVRMECSEVKPSLMNGKVPRSIQSMDTVLFCCDVMFFLTLRPDGLK